MFTVRGQSTGQEGVPFPKKVISPAGRVSVLRGHLGAPPTPPPDQYGGTFQEWGSRPDPLLTSLGPALGLDATMQLESQREKGEREKKNKYSKRS